MRSFFKLTAEDFLSKKIINFDFNFNVIIYDIPKEKFSSVKELAINKFGEKATVRFEVNNEHKTAPLSDINEVSCFEVVPISMTKRSKFSFSDLLILMEKLRALDGCPWDKVQTHRSIRKNVIEEAYELVEAIELKNNQKICEESGDVLLQAVFHAQIAKEQNNFDIDDVISGLCLKLITRHTHIFGENKASGSEEAIHNWEEAKNKEKMYSSYADKLANIPKTFGSIARANKAQSIARKAGFDFDDLKQAKDKIFEELEEISISQSEENLEWEAGDILFAVVNYVRLLGIDPEIALNQCTARFIKRFEYVEKRALEEGVELVHENIEKLEQFYRDSKKFENQKA